MSDPGFDLPPALPFAPDESVVRSGRPRRSAAAPAVVAAVAVAVVSVAGVVAPAARLPVPLALPPVVALAESSSAR